MNPIPPRSVLRLQKLWPHARKHGHEVGEIRRVGYYSEQDGLDCIWLAANDGAYDLTVDHDWLYDKFEVLAFSDEDDFYGENRDVLKPLTLSEIQQYQQRAEQDTAGQSATAG